MNASPLSSRPNSAQTRVPARRNADPVDEIDCEHEDVAERVADRGRLDVGALGRRALAALRGSNSRTKRASKRVS